MWPNPQETADLVRFIEEIINGKLHFLYSVRDIHAKIGIPNLLQSLDIRQSSDERSFQFPDFCSNPLQIKIFTIPNSVMIVTRNLDHYLNLGRETQWRQKISPSPLLLPSKQKPNLVRINSFSSSCVSTLSLPWWRFLSFRNQSIELQSNSFYMIGTSVMKELNV